MQTTLHICTNENGNWHGCDRAGYSTSTYEKDKDLTNRHIAASNELLGRDNNPDDDEQADNGHNDGQASRTWTRHQGMNCYNNHGAVGIVGKDPLPGSLTVDACKRKCVEEPTCEGIVLHSLEKE